MGLWVVLRNSINTQEFEKIFKDELSAQRFANNNGFEVQYCFIEGYVYPDKVHVASVYNKSNDFMEFFGVFFSREAASSKIKYLNKEKTDIIAVVPS